MKNQKNGDGIGEPVMAYKKSDVGKFYPLDVPATSDEFDDEKLGLQWQWNANYTKGDSVTSNAIALNLLYHI